jgi:hydroxymethylbilane synthase
VGHSLVVATRGSALALAQVELVKVALQRFAPDVHLRVKTITTSGDRKHDINPAPDPRAGLKGLFTKEIEDEILAGGADIGVHSLKDLPGRLAPGLAIAAVLERADPADVLIAKNVSTFDELPSGATLGTSSVRRQRQLQCLRPDLCVEPIRGNVPTRIQKLRENAHLDGIVLARAGLERLGIACADLAISALAILPAIGQGAIAIETRADSTEISALLARISHPPTALCIRAERELLRLLDGDCALPVGAATALKNDRLRLEAVVFEANESLPLRASAEGDCSNPEAVAGEVFAALAR